MPAGHAETTHTLFTTHGAAQVRSERLRIFHADEQACQSGASGQTLDACMKEARAVLARMRGEGSVSGSVSGGGMLRELVTH